MNSTLPTNLEKYIYISGNVPSSKNSKQYIPKIRKFINGKTTQRYVVSSRDQWESNLSTWKKMVENLEFPYEVKYYFFRDSRRKFDYINVCQILNDLMQTYGYIPDDDSLHIVPIFAGFEYNKEKAGVLIYV